jgi:hypothetical protein
MKIFKVFFLLALTFFIGLNVYAGEAMLAKQKQIQKKQAQQRQNIPQQPKRNSPVPSTKNNMVTKEVPQYSDTDAIIDLGQIFEELEFSSEIWVQIIDKDPKERIVQKHLDWYLQQGIVIQRPALHYVNLIDSMALQNKNLLNSPFKAVMKFVAIVEYDFNNGMNRDNMAKTVLGEELYYRNRKRLGLEEQF